MKAKATMNFNTAQRRYRAGEDVALADVSEAMFFLCTDAPKPMTGHSHATRDDSGKPPIKAAQKSN
jgi:hypothetical protein